MKRLILTAAVAFTGICAYAQTSIEIHDTKADGCVIAKEIYGQFAEHLGSGIYGGIWVGKDSPIPNEDGYRKDVLEALKALEIPVLRWPGGCFADEYHWMDGIGPQEKRPKICNSNWGGTLEDNSFGTHEFLNLCEKLGCEAYVSGNLGSGTVEEMAKWVEYMTSDSQSTIAQLRRENGRDKPWKVRYLGIGNESWGCGGSMDPLYYSSLFRRYANFTRNYSGNVLYKVASGANAREFDWTKGLMENIGSDMDGIAMHYYAVRKWSEKGSATVFSDREYALSLAKAVAIEEAIKGHLEVMDKADPEHKVDLLVDEWGTWYDVEPGTNPGHLFQQNTMRDAMVAALTLNIFHRHCDRISMANIAQMVNVLQAMILTDGSRMALTPTYHVFEMYRMFQGAEAVPVDNDSPMASVSGETYPTLDVTAARKDGAILIALTNTSLNKDQKIVLGCDSPIGEIDARILSCNDIRDHNIAGQAPKVSPSGFYSYKVKGGKLEFSIPAHSIIALKIK